PPAASAPKYDLFVPIESLRVGQRVVTRSEEDGSEQPSAVDAATWRKVHLRADTAWDDGTVDIIDVETLQPPEWVAQHLAQVGADGPRRLGRVEMGRPADWRAGVAANEPCPSIAKGPGRVVLTTVDHLNHDIRKLSFADSQSRAQVLYPTGLHKFKKVDGGRW